MSDDIDRQQVPLQGYLAGDDRQWATVVDAHGDFLYSVARRFTPDADRAADVVQEALIHLHHARRKFRPPHVEDELECNFRAWAAAFVRRCAATMLRGDRRRRQREQRAGTAMAIEQLRSDEGPIWSAEDVAALQDQLDLLPPDRREVLELRYFCGMSYAEIGAVLGIKENAARGRVHKAREQLRGRLVRIGATALLVCLSSIGNATEVATTAMKNLWLQVPQKGFEPVVPHRQVLKGPAAGAAPLMATGALVLGISLTALWFVLLPPSRQDRIEKLVFNRSAGIASTTRTGLQRDPGDVAADRRGGFLIVRFGVPEPLELRIVVDEADETLPPFADLLSELQALIDSTRLIRSADGGVATLIVPVSSDEPGDINNTFERWMITLRDSTEYDLSTRDERTWRLRRRAMTRDVAEDDF